MGMPGPCSKSSYDEPKIKYFKDEKMETYTDYEKPKVLGNPDPYNFRILKHLPVENYLIVLIRYPDCNNYEGNKVLVYTDVSIGELRLYRSLDPHFSNSKIFKSPIARFTPTNDGWDMATQFCIMMAQRNG